MKLKKIQAALEKINKEALNKVLSDADLDAVSGADAVSWLPDSMHFAVCGNCKKAYFVNPETCPHSGNRLSAGKTVTFQMNMIWKTASSKENASLFQA